ncbi:MAG TPA: helitron helicase-like domain-containing protein, partial [Chlamydiales bacterium]|nr:helitron helicase-like domain-containing protein [Chlamydiales bacterium]
MTSPTLRRERGAVATTSRMQNPLPPPPQPFPNIRPVASGSNDPFVVPVPQPPRANAPSNASIGVPTGVQQLELLRQQANAAAAQLQTSTRRRQHAPPPVPQPLQLGVQGVELLRQQANAAAAQLQTSTRYRQPVPQLAPQPPQVGVRNVQLIHQQAQVAVAQLQTSVNEYVQRAPLPGAPVQQVPPPQLLLQQVPPVAPPVLPPVRPAPPPVHPAPPPVHPVRLPLARSPIVSEADVPPHYMGRMNVPCGHCGALHWMAEKHANSSVRNPTFGSCCQNGQVILPPLPELPYPLQGLFAGTDDRHQLFFNKIRDYNNALAFVSVGVERDLSVNDGRGPYVYKIHGKLYHNHGSLLPDGDNPPVYAQLYIHDPTEALQHRHERNNIVDDRSLMQDLQDMMHQHNPFVQMYREAAERLRAQPQEIQHQITARITYRAHTDARRYNVPVLDEIAAILPDVPSDPNRPGRYWDIIVQLHSGQFKRIHLTSSAFMPLHYVLFFPRGELGWHPDIPRRVPEGRAPREAVNEDNEEEPPVPRSGRQRVTLIEYIAYYMFSRVGQPDTLLLGRSLSQEHWVGCWAIAEQNRLNWFETHQKELRAESYQGLIDAFAGMDDNVTAANIGTRVILPSSYTGGPRNSLKALQNSLAIVRHTGTQDLFITMTTDPNWPEIQETLLPGQTAIDRPDIVMRVFKQKKKELIKKIYKEGIFGRSVARVYAIEFQKRGLPHVHLLVWLHPEHKIRTPADVDSVVSAELPDPNTHPRLYRLVTTSMLHGPCGPEYPNAPCMKNGVCSKNFPKRFQEATICTPNAYPAYQRRNNGRVFTKQIAGRPFDFDNRWVVPHNPWCLLTWECHINVEITVNIHSVKYINKYVFKGGDRTTMEIQVNEITQYLNARYVSSPESLWRTDGNELYSTKPAVIDLPVHLPNQHVILYDENLDPQTIQERADASRTMLMGFFTINNHPEHGLLASQYLYVEFPEHYVWMKTRREWKLRQRGHGEVIGRVHFANPTTGERYYLRTLLHIVRGPKSFEDLRTYEGNVYGTFKGACQARGLLEN